MTNIDIVRRFFTRLQSGDQLIWAVTHLDKSNMWHDDLLVETFKSFVDDKLTTSGVVASLASCATASSHCDVLVIEMRLDSDRVRWMFRKVTP